MGKGGTAKYDIEGNLYGEANNEIYTKEAAKTIWFKNFWTSLPPVSCSPATPGCPSSPPTPPLPTNTFINKDGRLHYNCTNNQPWCTTACKTCIGPPKNIGVDCRKWIANEPCSVPFFYSCPFFRR